jgi:hypothetical protein
MREPRNRKRASRFIPLGLRHSGGERGQVVRHGAVVVQQVQPLGQVGDSAVRPLGLATRRLQLAGDHAQQGGLAAAVRAGQRDPLRPPDRQVGALSCEEGPRTVADLQPFAEEDGASGRDVGSG